MSKVSKVKDEASKDTPKDTPKETPKGSDKSGPTVSVDKGGPKGHGGFFGRTSGPGPVILDRPSSTTAGPSGSVRGGRPDEHPGGVFYYGGNVSGIGNRPTRTVSPPRPSETDTPRTSGGFFRRVDRQEGKPSSGTPVIGNYYGSTYGNDLRPVLQNRPGGFFATVDRVVESKRSGGGYFATVQNLERKVRHGGTWHTQAWWWYYPYDFRFYHWYYGYYDPFDPYYPYATYAYYPHHHDFYYWYPRPVVLVTPPALWITLWIDDRPSYRYSRDDDYYPYMERVRGSLGRAVQDIERGWRSEDIDLLMRHVHPDWDIRVLYKDEYSHTLSARQFEELTRDAFGTTRTEGFRVNSVKRHRDEETAVVKGVHTLRDPNGERRVVYVVYLLEEARDRYGDWDWYIREVGQSPEPY